MKEGTYDANVGVTVPKVGKFGSWATIVTGEVCNGLGRLVERGTRLGMLNSRIVLLRLTTVGLARATTLISSEVADAMVLIGPAKAENAILMIGLIRCFRHMIFGLSQEEIYLWRSPQICSN